MQGNELTEATDKAQNGLSKEVAKGQLDKWFEHYDVDPEDLGRDTIEYRGFNVACRKITRAIMKGAMVVGEDGYSITQHLSSGESVTYKELTGTVKFEMRKASGSDAATIPTLMGILSGVGVDGMKGLKAADQGRMEMLGVLFLAV